MRFLAKAVVEMHKKIVHRTFTLTIIVVLLLSAVTFIASDNASATSSGSTYSGLGDWSITSATVYTDETLVVRGNITLTGSGTLTLINTHLTVDVPTGGMRYINISTAGGGCWVRAQSDSVIDTINATAGIHNLKITTDNSGYIRFDNSTIKNTWIYQTGTVKDFINNCTLDQCKISAYYTRSWSMYGCTWQGSTISNAVILGSWSKISHCTFKNWTVPGTSILTNRLIYSTESHHLTIDNNTFEATAYPIMWLSGNTGKELTNLTFSDNVIDEVTRVGFYFDSQIGSSNILIKNNLVKSVIKTTAFKIGHKCQVIDNRFQSIDATGLASGTADGINQEGTIKGTIIRGNVFETITGPGNDTGAIANGFFTYLGGNFTAEDNVFWNIQSVANGICVSTGVGTNIIVQNNIIGNVTEASDGIGMYGGNGAIIRGNQIANVDLSSCGIRLALQGVNPHVYNNSVNSLINMTTKVQTSSGAYSINGEAHGIQGALFENNTIGWDTTAQYPGYNFTGTYSSTAEVYILGKDTVVFKNTAVTISYTGSSLWVNDVTAGTTTVYPNGTHSIFFASWETSRTLIVECPVFAPEITTSNEWTNDRIVDIALLVIIMGIITLFNYLGYVKNLFLLQILSFIVFIFVLVPLWPGSEIGGLLVLVFGIGNIGLLIGGLMK